MKDSPFIKPIDLFGNYYIYDVNRNDVVKVSRGLYEYLVQLERSPESECEEETVWREYESFVEKGYFSGHKMKVIRHPSTDLVEYYLDRKLSMVILQVTQNCNLRCSYCIYSDSYNEGQRSHSGKKMSLETAIRAVDFLAQHSIDSKKVGVSFYGGEPLLEMDLIKKVVDHAEDVLSGKDLTFSVTTNATLLTREIVAYMKEHHFNLMVSLDGPKSIHNTSRRFAADGVGSFDTIRKNLEAFREEYPDYFEKLSISMVIDPQNDFDEINSLFRPSDVFAGLKLHSSIIDDTYSLEKVTFSEEFIAKRNYQIFLAYLARMNRIDRKRVSPIAYEEVVRYGMAMDKMQKAKALPEEGAPNGPCVPGQSRLFADVDGNLYPCERVSENSPAMRIGNLTDGFDYEKSKELLNIGALTPEACRNCWAARLCSICPKHADDGGTLSQELKLARCQGIKDQALTDLKMWILMKEYA